MAVSPLIAEESIVSVSAVEGEVVLLPIGTKFIEGTLKGGTSYLYGYKNGGVGTTDMAYTKELISSETAAFIRDLDYAYAAPTH